MESRKQTDQLIGVPERQNTIGRKRAKRLHHAFSTFPQHHAPEVFAFSSGPGSPGEALAGKPPVGER
ncbi:hypothetical protein SDC9_201053 [bioreactor metagenome]|uniref:Uncharacterized protein n=1 Tax=bioreactor metagenome TaxID=1076179 RepID=A0A645ISM5_9ZZZZ